MIKKGREDEEEGVSSYWMTVRREGTGTRKRKCKSLQNSLWKKLWISPKTEYVMTLGCSFSEYTGHAVLL